jgi:hypothetical protein
MKIKCKKLEGTPFKFFKMDEICERYVLSKFKWSKMKNKIHKHGSP